jgi:hypothetical protein
MRLSRPEAPPPAIASPLRIAGGVFITATKHLISPSCSRRLRIFDLETPTDAIDPSAL